ncbi:hypothetical protein [Streptomyces sp. ODS28]|uniref:hypothetical protein n=1 Tax=Streptomyces sp. ODS28 TaxID=3136688 RepID=UPI0031E521F2
MAKRYDAQRQSWTEDGRDGAAERAAARRTQRLAALSAAAVLLVSSLGFGVWRAVDNALERDRQEKAWARAEASASARASREARDSASPSPGGTGDSGTEEAAAPSPGASAGAAPASGHERREDPQGWTVDVPEGWKRTEQKRPGYATVVNYESPGGDRRLQVFWVEDPTPYASAKLADDFLEDQATAYSLIRLDRLPGAGEGTRAPAVLEYAYEEQETGERRHTVDERFEAADGKLYAVAATGPDTGEGGASGASGAEARLVSSGVASFCPKGADCAGG